MNEVVKGRGSQMVTPNKFQNQYYDYDEDSKTAREELESNTEVFYETPHNVISKNNSDDLGFDKSINPYQGCEHGCIYCYARNSHEYWGFNAGIDFERKIVIKEKASELLEKKFLSKSWRPEVVMLSGNTDCYQPLERKFKITRRLLSVFEKYRNPVGMITKNNLITRDIDILSELAKNNLVQVMISITTLDETLRRVMEPRTSTGIQRLDAIQKLTDAGIPTGVMTAPIIPGLNDQEIPELLKRSAEAGAVTASYTVVRLNGQIAELFKDWVVKHYPDRSDKVLNQIKELHGGTLNDSDFGKRMKGKGVYSNMIEQLFKKSREKYFYGRSMPGYDFTKFRFKGNYSLF